TGDPLIHRLPPVRLHAENPRAGPDKDEFVDPLAARGGERLRGNPAHRVADHGTAIDAQRVEKAGHRLCQSLRAGTLTPVRTGAQRVEVDRDCIVFRKGVDGPVPELPAAEPGMEKDDRADGSARARRAAVELQFPAGYLN